MTTRQPRYTAKEAAQRGDAIYDRLIRPQVEVSNHGKYVAIDIETENWEMDTDENTASKQLFARVPDAQIYMTRVGYGYIRRFGAGRVRRGE